MAHVLSQPENHPIQRNRAQTVPVARATVLAWQPSRALRVMTTKLVSQCVFRSRRGIQTMESSRMPADPDAT
eukprot:5201-Eustigmatos_ZCMA.PRE.1